MERANRDKPILPYRVPRYRLTFRYVVGFAYAILGCGFAILAILSLVPDHGPDQDSYGTLVGLAVALLVVSWLLTGKEPPSNDAI